MHSDESASTVSARRRSVQCTSRHASTVLTCTVQYRLLPTVPLRRRAAQSGPRSWRMRLGRDVPYVSCTLPPQIRPTEITDWLKASGRGVTGCGPPYGHLLRSSPALPPHS